MKVITKVLAPARDIVLADLGPEVPDALVGNFVVAVKGGVRLTSGARLKDGGLRAPEGAAPACLSLGLSRPIY